MPKPAFASSQDPSQVSLTYSSLTQAIIWGVGLLAAHYGFNPTLTKDAVQQSIDIWLNIVPAIVVVYHGLTAIYGLVRKLFVQKVPTTTAPTV